MNKLVVSWFVVYAICIILTAIFQGGGGIVSTSLTSSLSSTETATINVSSTNGFRSADTVYIEDEQIAYTGKTATTFTGLTRARNRTSASAHTLVGTPVYSQELGTMNQASGAPVASSEIPGGTISATGFNLKFLVQALPQVVVWNYPFLTGQLIYLRIILAMVGVGLTISMVLATIGVLTKVF